MLRHSDTRKIKENFFLLFQGNFWERKEGGGLFSTDSFLSKQTIRRLRDFFESSGIGIFLWGERRKFFRCGQLNFCLAFEKKRKKEKEIGARGKRSFCFSAYIVYGEGNWAREPNAIRHMYTQRGEIAEAQGSHWREKGLGDTWLL